MKGEKMTIKGDKMMMPPGAKSGKSSSGFGLDSPKPIKMPFGSTDAPICGQPRKSKK